MYEEMGEISSNIKERILEFIESATEHWGNPEEVLEWYEKLETHLRNYKWEMIPNQDINRMLQSCITGPARREKI